MIPRRIFTLACVLFFLSGAAGLVYEVIWFKRFSQVWGSSALAAASVLGSYLLGLGAGAGVIGRVADRSRSPLRGYALCELGIGALALVVPYGIQVLEGIAAVLYPYIVDHPALGSLVRAFLTFLVLGPPCFLMGGTFPLLVKQLTPSGGTLRDSTGILYAANTLGGAAGAYLAGFHLLPGLGLPATSSIAVSVNLAVGAAALILTRFIKIEGGRASEASEAPLELTPPPSSRSPLDRVQRLILPAALLSGAGSLALQIAWTRQLSLILGSSTYAFSAMLLVVLAGIGLGSLIFHLGLKKARSPRRLQALIALALLATALLGQRLIDPLAVLVGSLRTLRSDPLWNAALSTLVASAIEILPSIGMGILLPAYAAASEKSAREAGTAAGDIYLWNTAGTLLGALGGALFILPTWGVASTVAIALSLYLFSAIILFPSEGALNKVSLSIIAAIGAGMVLLSARGPDPLLTNLGMYLYGDVTSDLPKNSFQPLFIEEGVSANVTVLSHLGEMISLRVNGKVDASTSRDMPTQLGSAYLPRFFRPEARNVLVIGFGSGTTSGASLLFPDTNVTCAELEPAVVRGSAFFKAVNHSPLESPRFKLVLNDGRGHVQGAKDYYDIIVSEPSNPWIAGVSNLFTREFYAAVKKRLAPGGVLAQWIQCYSLSPSDFALVVRTLREAFPHCALLRLSAADTILLGAESPLESTSEVMDRAQGLVDSLSEVKADLQKHFGATDVRSILLSRRILGENGLKKFVETIGGDTIQTDLNLRLEFDAPLRLFDTSLKPSIVWKSLLAASDTTAISETWERWGCTRAQLPALKDLLDLFADHENWEPAQKLIDFGLSVDPDEPHLLGSRFLSSMPKEEKAWDEAFSRILELSPQEAARIGVQLYVQKDFERSIRIWKRLLETNPQSATLWVNLGSSLRAKEEKDAARDAMEKARSLDPFSSFVRSRFDEKSEED